MREGAWEALLKSVPFSERVNSVSLGAEVLYYRLIAQSDADGNYWGEPRKILTKLFDERMLAGTVTAADIKNWRGELCKAGLSAVYLVDSKEYLHLIDLFRRQRKDVRKDLQFPAFMEAVTDAARGRNGDVALDKTKTKTRQETPTADAVGADVRKPRKEPSGDHAEFIAYFCERWGAKYGRKYQFQIGRDGKAAQTILKDAAGGNLELAKRIADRYLQSVRPFIVDQSHKLTILVNQLNSFTGESTAKSTGVSTETISAIAAKYGKEPR